MSKILLTRLHFRSNNSLHAPIFDAPSIYLAMLSHYSVDIVSHDEFLLDEFWVLLHLLGIFYNQIRCICINYAPLHSVFQADTNTQFYHNIHNSHHHRITWNLLSNEIADWIQMKNSYFFQFFQLSFKTFFYETYNCRLSFASQKV